MNYFDPVTAAARYAKGRPDFHRNTIQHIKAYLNPEQQYNKVLDIACGTGLSTRALLEIAEEVFGTDISQSMLSFAPQHPQIHYALAPAEKQPFEDHHFDLITVSSGVHWFNIEQFLREAGRLLKPKAWLVLYENHFIAEMEGNELFRHWYFKTYLEKFPSPPRNNKYDWSAENLGRMNFNFANEEIFRNEVRFTKQQLILYFTTQSNIISAVEEGRFSYEEVEKWLHSELNRFFIAEDKPHNIQFGNWIKYLQRID